MKHSCDLRVPEQNFNVMYMVYLRHNVGKNVESECKGPLVIIEVMPVSVYIAKSRREQKIMHHDKLNLCESKKLQKRVGKITQTRQKMGMVIGLVVP